MRIQEYVPLAPLTTAHVGGPARYFARIESHEDLKEAWAWSKAARVPLWIFGGGSNVLIPDEGLDALVLQIAIEGISFETWKEKGEETEEKKEKVAQGRVLVRAGAGVCWDALVAETVRRGLRGLENLSCIPGTVGGTPIQNVGAYGASTSDTCIAVGVFDMKTGAFAHLAAQDCAFAYRDSLFKRAPWLAVVEVSFLLTTQGSASIAYRDLAAHFKDAPEPELAAVREAVCAIRARKFPRPEEVGTAGSFFKNLSVTAADVARIEANIGKTPPAFLQPDGLYKVPTAWVLEQLGWKGKREGNVGVHTEHALVLVNYGGAQAGELLAFARAIQKEVQEKISLSLAIEPTVVSREHFFLHA